MKRIYRDRFDKKMGGVCGGIGQYLQIDATVIRLLFIFLSVFTGGFFILIYLLLWAIFPIGPKSYIEAKYRRLFRSRSDRKFAGICGGFAKYIRVDANILRVAVIVLFFVTGMLPIFIAYVIGIAIIPEEIPRHR